jgi:hypothetical protein
MAQSSGKRGPRVLPDPPQHIIILFSFHLDVGAIGTFQSSLLLHGEDPRLGELSERRGIFAPHGVAISGQLHLYKVHILGPRAPSFRITIDHIRHSDSSVSSTDPLSPQLSSFQTEAVEISRAHHLLKPFSDHILTPPSLDATSYGYWPRAVHKPSLRYLVIQICCKGALRSIRLERHGFTYTGRQAKLRG